MPKRKYGYLIAALFCFVLFCVSLFIFTLVIDVTFGAFSAIAFGLLAAVTLGKFINENLNSNPTVIVVLDVLILVLCVVYIGYCIVFGAIKASTHIVAQDKQESKISTSASPTPTSKPETSTESEQPKPQILYLPSQPIIVEKEVVKEITPVATPVPTPTKVGFHYDTTHTNQGHKLYFDYNDGQSIFQKWDKDPDCQLCFPKPTPTPIPVVAVQTGVPIWYEATGNGITKTFNITVNAGEIGIVGGFRIDGVSDGVYRAFWPGTYTITITDGFALRTTTSNSQNEWNFRLAQARQFGWAMAHIDKGPLQ